MPFCTHNKTHSRVYNIWAMMRQRCTNPRAANYITYGARGITVCERWARFKNFYADMGDPPSAKHTLDRIDLNGPYTPENCRWADVETQQNNRSSSVKITAFGETLSVAQWARRTGLTRDMVQHRIFTMRMDPEAALTAPRMSHNLRAIIRYRPDGSDMQRFESLAAAAKAMTPGADYERIKKAIWQALSGKARTSHGYCWAYAELGVSESSIMSPDPL